MTQFDFIRFEELLSTLGCVIVHIGFGVVTTLVALLFSVHGWANGWLAYTSYALAFILVLARIFLSHLADAIGGRRLRWSLHWPRPPVPTGNQIRAY
jgi:hypothetical protein